MDDRLIALRAKATRLVDVALTFLAGSDDGTRREIAKSAGLILDLCGGPTVVLVYEEEE
jgi:hypothetical protein